MRTFIFVVLLIWTAIHVYVFWRASTVPLIARHRSRYLLVGLGCLLWGSYILSRVLHRFGIGIVARILESIGANWIGVLFLLLVWLLAVDLITVFGRVKPRFAPSLRGWALLAGGLMSAVALVQGCRAPVVDDYGVRLTKLPAEMDGTVLVFVSDFHLGTQLGKDWLDARIRQIQAQRPDIIILGGDILEGDDTSEGELLSSLRALSAPFGVWGVSGNHESHGETQSSTDALEMNGIQMLHDRWAEIRPGFILAGVDDLTSRHRHGYDTLSPIQRALGGRPAGTATILISHTPGEVETAATLGADLMLSSHTHEGQIWPFNYVVRLEYPYLAGRYEVHGMPIIVCRGTGTWGPRMRLWQRGEIIRITLHSGSPQSLSQSDFGFGFSSAFSGSLRTDLKYRIACPRLLPMLPNCSGRR